MYFLEKTKNLINSENIEFIRLLSGADIHNTSSNLWQHTFSVLYSFSSYTEEYIMSNIIEELFYGNLEPQELTTEITPRLKKKPC